ncbi:hypothetical protein GGR51DRAFT_577981 [Nemania sp. FL0031]|nr:hypothetical protein GGR51DRAFT_577981 [Nemania sp. FL0031]
MTDPFSCPEDANSTHCLLRVLLQKIDDHFEEYNWDPITFGFTVPDPKELSNAPPSSQSRFRTWGSKLTYPLRKLREANEKNRPPKSLSGDPAVASWLGFLDELGLDYALLKDIPLKGNIADYLPSDLLAVPAYAEIKFILGAAAAAGAHSWELDGQSGYPTIISSSFQFEFRQHPILGTVGAFTKYSYDLDTPDKSTDTLDKSTARHLATEIQNSKGDLKVCRGVCEEGELLERHPLPDLLNIQMDMSYAFSLALIVLRARDDKHNLTWAFLAQIPPRPPAIFPTKYFQSSQVFTFLALHSKFWAGPDALQPFSSENEQVKLPNLVPGREILGTSLLPAGVKGEQIDVDRLSDILEDNLEPGELVTTIFWKINLEINKDITNKLGRREEFEDCVPILGDFIEASVKFLYNRDGFCKWFSALQQTNKQYFRVLILIQVQLINKLFKNYTREELICQIYSLWRTTLILLDAERAIADGYFGPPASKGKQNPPWSDDFKSRFPDHLSVKHQGILHVVSQTLGELAESGLLDEKDVWASSTRASECVKKVRTKEKGLAKTSLLKCSLGFEPQWTDSLKLNTATMPLRALNKVLETLRGITVPDNTMIDVGQPPEEKDSDAESQNPPNSNATTSANEPHVRASDGKGKEDPSKSKAEGEKSREDTIRDLLIWKYTLLGMLYSTAPDNTDLLLSGVLERVVPILWTMSALP